jgi:ribosomal protein S27E
VVTVSSVEEEQPTHYCEDCETELVVFYDIRHDAGSTPIVCGQCGGTNTHRLGSQSGGEDR